MAKSGKAPDLLKQFTDILKQLKAEGYTSKDIGKLVKTEIKRKPKSRTTPVSKARPLDHEVQSKPVPEAVSKSRSTVYRENYQNRLISTMKRYNTVYGEIDTRFHNVHDKKVQKEFYDEFMRKKHYMVLSHSRTKQYSRKEKSRLKKTADWLQLNRQNLPEVYPAMRR